MQRVNKLFIRCEEWSEGMGLDGMAPTQGKHFYSYTCAFGNSVSIPGMQDLSFSL